MTKSPLLLAVALCGLLAACNKPAETPAAPVEAPAVEMPPSDAPAPEVAPATPELPADHTTAEQKAELEKGAAAAGVPVTKQSRTTFACDNGETVEVRFFPDQGIAVLVRGVQNVELQQKPTADGFEYSNGQTTIRGKGNELTLNVGMMATAKCTAKSA